MEFGASFATCSSNTRWRSQSILRLCSGLLIGLIALGVLPRSAAQVSGGRAGVSGPSTPGGVGTPMSDTQVGNAPIDTRRGVAIRIAILDEQKQPLKQQALVRVTSQSSGRILFQTARGLE